MSKIKRKKIKAIAGWGALIIMVLAFFALAGFIIWATVDSEIDSARNHKFCAEEIPQYKYAYERNKGLHKKHYHEEITEDYINCCWEEPYLNTEGAYEQYKCKGYKKEAII